MFCPCSLFPLCNIIASETSICVLCKLGHVIYQLNMYGRMANSCGLSHPQLLDIFMAVCWIFDTAYRGTERRVKKQTTSAHLFFLGGLLFTARYVLSALPVREKRTGLFEMIVGVVTTCHLVLQMQPHVISFFGVTSRIRFKFLLFPQVSSARILQRSTPQPLPTTSSRTRTTHQMQ